MKSNYKYHTNEGEMISKDVAMLWADEDKKRGINSNWQVNYRTIGKLIEKGILKAKPYTTKGNIKVLNIEEAMNIYNRIKPHEVSEQIEIFEGLQENGDKTNETNINIIIDEILSHYNSGKLDKKKTGELLKELINK